MLDPTVNKAFNEIQNILQTHNAVDEEIIKIFQSIHSSMNGLLSAMERLDERVFLLEQEKENARKP